MRAEEFDAMLDGELRAEANREPRAGWQGRVMAGVEAEARRGRRVWKWGWSGALALVLLMAGALGRWRGEQGQRGGTGAGKQTAKVGLRARAGGGEGRAVAGRADVGIAGNAGAGSHGRVTTGAAREGDAAGARVSRVREGEAREEAATAKGGGGEERPELATFPALRHEAGGGWFGGETAAEGEVLSPEAGRALAELRASQAEPLRIAPMQLAALRTQADAVQGSGSGLASLKADGGRR